MAVEGVESVNGAGRTATPLWLAILIGLPAALVGVWGSAQALTDILDPCVMTDGPAAEGGSGSCPDGHGTVPGGAASGPWGRLTYAGVLLALAAIGAWGLWQARGATTMVAGAALALLGLLLVFSGVAIAVWFSAGFFLWRGRKGRSERSATKTNQ